MKTLKRPSDKKESKNTLLQKKKEFILSYLKKRNISRYSILEEEVKGLLYPEIVDKLYQFARQRSNRGTLVSKIDEIIVLENGCVRYKNTEYDLLSGDLFSNVICNGHFELLIVFYDKNYDQYVEQASSISKPRNIYGFCYSDKRISLNLEEAKWYMREIPFSNKSIFLVDDSIEQRTDVLSAPVSPYELWAFYGGGEIPIMYLYKNKLLLVYEWRKYNNPEIYSESMKKWFSSYFKIPDEVRIIYKIPKDFEWNSVRKQIPLEIFKKMYRGWNTKWILSNRTIDDLFLNWDEKRIRLAYVLIPKFRSEIWRRIHDLRRGIPSPNLALAKFVTVCNDYSPYSAFGTEYLEYWCDKFSPSKIHLEIENVLTSSILRNSYWRRLPNWWFFDTKNLLRTKSVSPNSNYFGTNSLWYYDPTLDLIYEKHVELRMLNQKSKSEIRLNANQKNIDWFIKAREAAREHVNKIGNEIPILLTKLRYGMSYYDLKAYLEKYQDSPWNAWSLYFMYDCNRGLVTYLRNIRDSYDTEPYLIKTLKNDDSCSRQPPSLFSAFIKDLEVYREAWQESRKKPIFSNRTFYPHGEMVNRQYNRNLYWLWKHKQWFTMKKNRRHPSLFEQECSECTGIAVLANDQRTDEGINFTDKGFYKIWELKPLTSFFNNEAKGLLVRLLQSKRRLLFAPRRFIYDSIVKYYQNYDLFTRDLEKVRYIYYTRMKKEKKIYWVLRTKHDTKENIEAEYSLKGQNLFCRDHILSFCKNYIEVQRFLNEIKSHITYSRDRISEVFTSHNGKVQLPALEIKREGNDFHFSEIQWEYEGFHRGDYGFLVRGYMSEAYEKDADLLNDVMENNFRKAVVKFDLIDYYIRRFFQKEFNIYVATGMVPRILNYSYYRTSYDEGNLYRFNEIDFNF